MSTPMERAAAAMASGPVLTPRATGKRKAGDGGARPSCEIQFGQKEKKLACDGHLSRRDASEKAMRYVRILQEGANNIPGILARYDREGDELIPYMHQRQAVKKAACRECKFMVLAHQAGTGKTATFFQLFAAMEQLVAGGGARCIVTVPPSTLPQWEQTAHDWLNLREQQDAIVCTNQAKKITEEVLKRVRVLVISRHLLANLFKQCWEYAPEYERNERGQWVSKWVRKEAVPLHPLWKEQWDLLGVDEAHFMRNPVTEWCVSHNQLSKGLSVGNGVWVGGCKKRIALTATPVLNKPLDMVGLCKAINASPELQQKTFWSRDRQCKTINKATVEIFQAHTDRVKDDILGLPPIHQQTHSFDPSLPESAAAEYNVCLHKARSLRLQMEQNRVSSKELRQLIYMLQKMQQLLVSPLLARVGAKDFKLDKAYLDEASKVETGSLRALRQRLLALKADGHRSIVVAANHVTMMNIGKHYLERQNEADPENSVGNILLYDGTLTLSQRSKQRLAFLNEEQTVLFLSIGAGGTGLHLVPTKRDTPKEGFCCACVFWGSRPFSPQQVWQTLKRIHRIGQKYEVFVHHLIATGSVDFAINCVHSDKEGLANAIVDNDWSNCDEVGGEWRRTGRIVDQCYEMMADGNFPPGGVMPTGVPSDRAAPPPDPPPDPPPNPLTSHFFRQPLQAAATKPGAAAPRLPLPEPATTMPFGPALLHTGKEKSASTLVEGTPKLSFF